jgi:hypothetical protein
VFSRVVCQRREASEFGDGLVRERADFGHLGHHAGHGAVGNAFDGAEGEIEFAPQRVLLEEPGDLLLEGADLLLDHVQECHGNLPCRCD